MPSAMALWPISSAANSMRFRPLMSASQAFGSEIAPDREVVEDDGRRALVALDEDAGLGAERLAADDGDGRIEVGAHPGVDRVGGEVDLDLVAEPVHFEQAVDLALGEHDDLGAGLVGGLGRSGGGAGFRRLEFLFEDLLLDRGQDGGLDRAGPPPEGGGGGHDEQEDEDADHQKRGLPGGTLAGEGGGSIHGFAC